MQWGWVSWNHEFLKFEVLKRQTTNDSETVTSCVLESIKHHHLSKCYREWIIRDNLITHELFLSYITQPLRGLIADVTVFILIDGRNAVLAGMQITLHILRITYGLSLRDFLQQLSGINQQPSSPINHLKPMESRSNSSGSEGFVLHGSSSHHPFLGTTQSSWLVRDSARWIRSHLDGPRGLELGGNSTSGASDQKPGYWVLLQEDC